MVELFVLVVASYLVGSLSGSLLLGKLRGVDIRSVGSGNAGGTNALRTQGAWFALGTVLVDVGKGALAAWLAMYLLDGSLREAGVVACVLAAMTGHVWPIFHGFRGGKGAATLLGGLLVAWPYAGLSLIAVWMLCMLCSGYVGLSTVLAGASLPIFGVVMSASASRMVLATIAALFLVFTHRGNLLRIRAGVEPRSNRVRLLGRLFARDTVRRDRS